MNLTEWTVETDTIRVCLSCLLAEADEASGKVTDIGAPDLVANFETKKVLILNLEVISESECEEESKHGKEY